MITKCEVVEYKCEFCGNNFKKYTKPSRYPYRFCSKVCASKHCVSVGKNGYSSKEKRKEYLTEKFDSLTASKIIENEISNRSKRTTEKNTGRKLSDKSKKKISRSCKGIPNKLKGKTYKEFYGEKRALELSNQHSEKLKEGYATGKISPTVRVKNAPTYKGVKLRSKLELSAIKFLESDGLIFGKTLFYEHVETKVTWIDDKGSMHTYTPDLYDVKNEVVYEVKPQWKVDNPTDEMKRKFKAASSSFQKFKYLTDLDIEGKRHGRHKETNYKKISIEENCQRVFN